MRRFYTRVVVLIMPAMLMVVGCSRSEDRDGVAPVTNDFVLSVNGQKLTQKDMNRRVEMMVRLKTLSQPETTAKDLEKFRSVLTRTYPDVFVSDVLLKGYAEENGIQTTTELLEAARTSAVRRYRQTRAKSWADLMKKMGESAQALGDQIEFEARRNQVYRHLVALNPTNIPPDFAQKQIDFAKSYNARMDLTNAVIYARATNVWQQLVKGGDFNELAAKWSEIPTEKADRGDWAALDWQQIERDPPLYSAAKALKPGEFSSPIEADNGLLILRVDKKDEKECKMSRIFFCLPLYKEVPTEEKVISVVKQAHGSKIFNAKMRELKEKAVIVKGSQYPQADSAAPKDVKKTKEMK